MWWRLDPSNELNVDEVEVVEERLELEQGDRVTVIEILIHPLLSWDPACDTPLQPLLLPILCPSILL